MDLSVLTLSPPELSREAWELAVELNLPTVYDTAYLALAQIEGCDFWTADRSFYRVASGKYGFVRLLGEDLSLSL